MAKAPQGAVRMNISVPAGLKQRMDKVRVDVNWSAIAAEAFTLKLGEIAQQKEKKVMSDVVERLRASKLQGDSLSYREGVSAGEMWAKECADARQLQRLDRKYDEWSAEVSMGWEGWFDPNFSGWNHRGLVGNLCDAINGTEDQVDHEFWEEVFGHEWRDSISDNEMLRGFCDGALKVWWDVKDQL